MGSIAVENFIKAIYRFEHQKGFETKPGIIAGELGISNAAATDMARKLSSRKLIYYEKYKALKLTSAGNKMALNIIRKHRLWETFLYQVLGLSMHEIHREAEMLEHLTSDFLMEKINLYLGNPLNDPHGDPIPNNQGRILTDDNRILLSMVESDRKYKICRLIGTDQEYFDFCNANQLEVGSEIVVKNQYVKNRMTEIEVNNSRLLLNAEIANTIYVQKIENKK